MIIKTNGIELFYEKIGKGKPLIFLHGNGEDHHTFDSLTKALKEYYTCYLVDSRNHGSSSQNQPLHYEDMADDIYDFITILDLENPIVFGFSDGAITAMILSINHPMLLHKMILAGGSLDPYGVKKSFFKMMEAEYEKSKNPFIELMLKEPSISSTDLHQIKCPTLILAGENDLIKYSHTKKIHQGILNSEMIIVQGHDHESYILNSDYLAEIIIKFA
ncbi:MAG: alpha/beta hydrolase [Firmicutes bacterium]|nr:alpha/beta hydrolase [Bacillota bacterium]